MHLEAQKCASVVSRSVWKLQRENSHAVHHGENYINTTAHLHRDSVKQDHSESVRLKPKISYSDDSLEGISNQDWLGMLFNETSPENSQFLNDTMADMLHFNTAMRPREEESSGVHHGISEIKTEEPTVDINRLLFYTSDEPTSIYNTCEASGEITIKDNVTNFSKNGNMRNIRNNNKRYENTTADQLLSSVNMRNYNINSVEDEFYNHTNSFLDSSNKSSDISSVVNNSTVYDDTIYKDVLWSETNSVITTPPSYETPDNSRSPIITTYPKDINLLLDFKDVQFVSDEINTPNIIDAIIENEKLDFTSGIGEKIIITSLTPDEVQQNASSSETQIQESTVELPVENITDIIEKCQPKKEYIYYGDDDSNCSSSSDLDYVPPTKQKRFSLKRNTIEADEFKVGKRGRPPKRNFSISSDDYSQLDPSEARYRVMRDRNNEASRKSRQKRKSKEVETASEMKELEMENIRLKAQVNELQKTVDRYRDNLMKVMLNKK